MTEPLVLQRVFPAQNTNAHTIQLVGHLFMREFSTSAIEGGLTVPSRSFPVVSVNITSFPVREKASCEILAIESIYYAPILLSHSPRPVCGASTPQVVTMSLNTVFNAGLVCFAC